MKKLFLLLALLTSSVTFAQEATGVIEEIKVCGAGKRAGEGWARVLLFKVDGKWFGTYAEYAGSPNDHDNNISTSLIFMAYSQNAKIEIKATDTWSSNFFQGCGVTEGGVFHDKAGDYIRLIK